MNPAILLLLMNHQRGRHTLAPPPDWLGAFLFVLLLAVCAVLGYLTFMAFLEP